MQDFIEIIKQSDHFDKLTDLDKKARNITDISKYKSRYIANVVQFTREEMHYITGLCQMIDKHNFHTNIRWIFAKLQYDITIEHGFPHTMGNVIVLRSDFFDYPIDRQINLLIHEKVHIWQKHNKTVMNQILYKQNYTLTNKQHTTQAANMDTYGVWQKNNKIYDTHYNDGYKSECNDRYEIQDEHPYELYAEAIANSLTNQIL